MISGAVCAAAVGDVLPERRVGPLTRMDLARFSIAADDPNRLHIEESVATAAGFPDVIGSGGIVVVLLTDLVTSWAGMEALRSASLRVTAPLYPGTVVIARGEVTRRVLESGGTVEVEVYAEDERGERLGQGTFHLQALERSDHD